MKPSLLYFTGSWCQPCLAFLPIVERCAEEASIPLTQLLVRNHCATAKRYDIRGIPALVLLRQGKKAKVAHGPKSAAWLERWLNA